MDNQETHKASYLRFWTMVTVATVIGFGAMYLNTYQLDQIFHVNDHGRNHDGSHDAVHVGHVPK